MKIQIDFYHWDNICPISNEIISLLEKYKENFEIQIYDITHNFKKAREQDMYYPFLTVVNRKYRFYSPISEDFVKKLLLGKIPREELYRPMLGKSEKSFDILPIKKDNYLLASKCTARNNCVGVPCKINMYHQASVDVFGFMNVKDNILLGGAEFYPSNIVPYDIPKGDDIAFITCVYMSDENYDYKSAPLRALEEHLSYKYSKVIVISDEIGLFPNGDLEFFIRNGYIDEKIVFKDDYCKLHLLSKVL